MVIDTKFGSFELLINEQDAFNIVKFEERYIPEYFDKYPFIVGDIASEILRLKGFTIDSKSPNFFHYIPDYLVESCTYHCAFYVLKRLKSENEINQAKSNNSQPKTVEYVDNAYQILFERIDAEIKEEIVQPISLEKKKNIQNVVEQPQDKNTSFEEKKENQKNKKQNTKNQNNDQVSNTENNNQNKPKKPNNNRKKKTWYYNKNGKNKSANK